jgi:hypothetical protein
MKKVYAEILAGLIPHKMTRNRMRGIFRYGLANAVQLKRRINNDHSQPEHFLAVCAIAKNEGPYFKEWIEWHLQQGVEKFYIYDNESTDGTKDILEPYIKQGIVDYKYWPGYRQQLAAYDDCLEVNRFSSHWIAFIDLDEFIVPIKDKSITEFLKRFDSFAAVEINWLIYGSGGQEHKAPEAVMERFKFHSNPDHRLNRHVKSIVNPRRVFTVVMRQRKSQVMPPIPMDNPSKSTSASVSPSRTSSASTIMQSNRARNSSRNNLEEEPAALKER